MKNEYLFYFFVILIYMGFNLYTDLKYLKTKNWWHLSFLIILFCLSLLTNNLLGFFISFFGGAALGGLLKISLKDYGNGDIKMLMILFASFSLIELQTFNDYLYVSILYIVISGIHFGVCKLIQLRTKETKRCFTYSISKDYIEVPEAIPITLVFLLVFVNQIF